MKYLFIIVVVASIFIFNTNAKAVSSKFELSYKDSFLELDGEYLKIPVNVRPVDDLYQVSNKTPVGAFRNIYSAYILNDLEWLKQHYVGNINKLILNIKQYRKIIKKQRLSLNGYVIFKNYAIIFLQTERTDEKLIMVLEEKDKEYKLCFNFDEKFSKTYNTILKSYSNLGLFKVIKKK